MNAGGIGREGLAVAAEELVNGGFVVLAGEVPEGDIDGGYAELCLLAHGLLDAGVDVFPFERVLSDEHLGDDAGPGVLDGPAPHVLSGHASIRRERDGMGGVGYRLAGRVGRAVLASRKVGQIVGERLDLDLGDSGIWHGGFLCYSRSLCLWIRRAGSAVR